MKNQFVFQKCVVQTIYDGIYYEGSEYEQCERSFVYTHWKHKGELNL